MPAPVRLVPLGGLGEVGMNCLAVEEDDSILVIDCGIAFDPRGIGVDVVHADLGYLLERREKVTGLVLTHGHEDHVGAASWFLRELPVPVWGPPYAVALLRQRAAEHAFHRRPLDLRTMGPRIPFRQGPFGWELLRVTHSMPDSHALLLETGAGTILHTADFKLDHDPPEGERFDLERIDEAARRGVRLMLSDSTNALTPGRAGGERAVAVALEELVAEAPGRVVMGLFASNVQRIRAVLEIARKHGRRVVPLGRSIDSHLAIARELGHLPDVHDLLVPRERARQVRRRECLVLATGSQGEGPAALPRLGAGTHPDLDLEPGDRVILSSRVIPGNERAVWDLVNLFERQGIEVVHRGSDPRVHASGHAHRDELAELIARVRPRAFVPVHGTFVQLRAHAELARAAGVGEIVLTENGGIIEVDAEGIRLRPERVPTGRVYIDHHEPVAERVLHDRSLLARLGVVFVTVAVGRNGRRLGEPQVVSRGVIDEDAEADLLAQLRDEVAAAVDGIGGPALAISDEEIRDAARRAVRRYFGRELGRRPLAFASVVRHPG